MRKWGIFAGVWLALSLGLGQAPALAQESVEPSGGQPVQVICPAYTLVGELDPPLTATEKKLVCGGEHAWKDIPFSQARYNLANFLQDRGNLHPVFKIDTPPGPGQRFTVYAGEPTRVTSLAADGAPEELRLQRKRKVVGEIMTPRLLGQAEQWVFQRMQSLGYPCPKVTAEADPDTGAVVIHVEPGPLQDLVAVFEEPIPGAMNGVLRRYDAFQLGKRFNGDLLTVTENRVTQLRVLQNTYFTVSCEEKGAVARQEVAVGPPRLLTLGFGANTEGLLLGRASWRNTRLGNRMSLIDVTLQASSRLQRLTGLANWYYLPFVTRRYLLPSVELRHENEPTFEVLSAGSRLLLATSYDNQVMALDATLGPTFEYYRTIEGSGSGDPNSFFTSLELGLRARNHAFEYWTTNPRTGFSVGGTLALSSAQFLSSATAQRLRFSGQYLWNYRDYDPPLWVLGFRGGYSVTISDERPGPQTRLPASFFNYLGGSIDLRGFERRGVPSQGALSAGFIDTEVRFTEGLPYQIEPLVFVDVGAVGLQPWTFDSPLLYSPGIGLRWKSPVGVFRTTLARGFPVENSGGWHFYFSFGEEF